MTAWQSGGETKQVAVQTKDLTKTSLSVGVCLIVKKVLDIRRHREKKFEDIIDPMRKTSITEGSRDAYIATHRLAKEAVLKDILS